MVRILQLLLPALIPSWNFFDVIVPSPRIQFSILNPENELQAEWQEFRPRPADLSIWQMLGRMLSNPVWNESLFLMSCAERLMEYPTRHSEDEIFKTVWNMGKDSVKGKKPIALFISKCKTIGVNP